ncbi:MAG: peptidylprolyl isomerase [Bryobacteraceae bacterium]|jgi:peptidyl-prolyl cis-trans isomerase SurA
MFRSLKSLGCVAAVCVLMMLAPACKKSPPADVAATVNNRPITYTDLEKAYQQSQLAAPGQAEEQTMAQKLELLRNLIDSEILLQRAEKQGLLAGDADVETKLTELRAPWTREQFEQQLRNSKMTLDDLKSKIRRELSIQKLINKDITSHIVITDADVTNFYNANKAGFNLAEPQVHMAQILVTPNPEPSAGNLQNSKAQNDAEANRKIHQIQERLQRGEDFGLVAHNYSEDPNSAPNGGDMGFIPESALQKADMELRRMVMSLSPGSISQIVRTQEGYRIFKIISKESAGQRELNDPRVQQSIRETLLNRKDQLLKNAYYEVARNDAKVVNYLAQKVVESAGKK